MEPRAATDIITREIEILWYAAMPQRSPWPILAQ